MREQNLQLVRDAYEAFGKGDLEALRSMNAETAVWHTPGIATFSADYKGVDEVLRYFGQLFELSEGTVKVEPERMYAGDDGHVLVVDHVTASRHGKHIEFHDVIDFEIRDGKFVSSTQYEVDVKALEDFWT